MADSIVGTFAFFAQEVGLDCKPLKGVMVKVESECGGLYGVHLGAGRDFNTVRGALFTAEELRECAKGDRRAKSYLKAADSVAALNQ